ncbi:MAG: hypothetical protein ABI881_09770 [Betaproteobacteria bacterium]
MRNPIHASGRAAAVVVALLLGGCAGTMMQPAPEPVPVPRNVEPPRPTINLDGFPLPYRQGYADGCASAGGAERKDVARFAGDGNYRTGWTDGRGLCARK